MQRDGAIRWQAGGSGRAQKAFDKVHMVPYHRAECTQLRSPNQRRIYGLIITYYGAWMPISLTWYQSLKLDQYNKVLLLESDIAILCNMDSLSM